MGPDRRRRDQGRRVVPAGGEVRAGGADAGVRGSGGGADAGGGGRRERAGRRRRQQLPAPAARGGRRRRGDVRGGGVGRARVDGVDVEGALVPARRRRLTTTSRTPSLKKKKTLKELSRFIVL